MATKRKKPQVLLIKQFFCTVVTNDDHNLQFPKANSDPLMCPNFFCPIFFYVEKKTSLRTSLTLFQIDQNKRASSLKTRGFDLVSSSIDMMVVVVE